MDRINQTPLFRYQIKSRQGIPSYVRQWLRAAQGDDGERIGVLIWQEPHKADAEALVVVRFADWVELHGIMGMDP